MRLPVALRGYRFAETDLLLDRLVEEIRTRDEHIDRLSRELTRVSYRPAPGQVDDADSRIDADRSESGRAVESGEVDHRGEEPAGRDDGG